MARPGRVLTSNERLPWGGVSGNRKLEMAVGRCEGVYHVHLRRSTTEGAPADRRPLLRIDRLSAGGSNESFYGFALPVNPPPFFVSFSTAAQALQAFSNDARELYGAAFE